MLTLASETSICRRFEKIKTIYVNKVVTLEIFYVTAASVKYKEQLPKYKPTKREWVYEYKQ